MSNRATLGLTAGAVPVKQITVYGCGPDEAALFRELAPRFGVAPTITDAPVSEANIDLARGNRCISVGHKTPDHECHASGAQQSRRGVHLHAKHRIRPHRRGLRASVGIRVGDRRLFARQRGGLHADADADGGATTRNPSSAVPTPMTTGCTDVRGRELRDLTVGVVGTGRIGAAVIERLRGFGCRILAYDNRPTTGADYVSLDDLLRHSDIVTLHTPLTADYAPSPRSPAHRADEARRVHRQHRTRRASRHRGADLRRWRAAGWAARRWTSSKERRASSTPTAGDRPIDSTSCCCGCSGCRTCSSARTPPTTPTTPWRHRREHHRQLPEIRAGESGVDRLKVGIIFGGCSEEHPVSVKSAQEVAKHLDLAKYEPFYIGITTSGAWKLCDGPGADWENGRCRPAVLSPDRSVHGLLVLEQGRYETIRLDRGASRAARQARRGRRDPGPAGAFRHPLRRLRHPELRPVHGQVPGLHRRRQRGNRHAELLDASRRTRRSTPTSLRYPVFVKPARSGSSFGVSKVTGEEELPGAVHSRAAVRLEGPDRRGCRRQRGRMRDPRGTVRTGRRRGRPDRPFARLLPDPSGETRPRAAPRTRPFIVPADISGAGPLARPGDGEGHLPRPGLQGTRAGGHVPHRRRARSSSTRSTRCPA